MRSLVLLLLVLSGCASLPPSPTPLVKTAQAFSLEARFTAQVFDSPPDASSKPSQSISGGLNWAYDRAEENLSFIGPLGIPLVQARRTAQGVEASFANGQHSQAATWEALLEPLLGYALPLTQGVHWIQGKPDPMQSSQQTTTGFKQSDWQIELEARHEDSRPRLMRWQQLAPPYIKVRWVIDSWQ
jgi:outer membrane biogenesis lipoprotein LolB